MEGIILFIDGARFGADACRVQPRSDFDLDATGKHRKLVGRRPNTADLYLQMRGVPPEAARFFRDEYYRTVDGSQDLHAWFAALTQDLPAKLRTLPPEQISRVVLSEVFEFCRQNGGQTSVPRAGAKYWDHRVLICPDPLIDGLLERNVPIIIIATKSEREHLALFRQLGYTLATGGTFDIDFGGFLNRLKIRCPYNDLMDLRPLSVVYVCDEFIGGDDISVSQLKMHETWHAVDPLKHRRIFPSGHEFSKEGQFLSEVIGLLGQAAEGPIVMHWLTKGFEFYCQRLDWVSPRILEFFKLPTNLFQSFWVSREKMSWRGGYQSEGISTRFLAQVCAWRLTDLIIRNHPIMLLGALMPCQTFAEAVSALEKLDPGYFAIPSDHAESEHQPYLPEYDRRVFPRLTPFRHN